MVFPSPLMEQIAGSLNNGRGSAGSRGGLNTSGDPANPDGTGPSKYGCARCGRSYQHQATLRFVRPCFKLACARASQGRRTI